MAIVPPKPVDLIQFYEDRVAPTKPWAAHTVDIGLVAGDVTSLNTKAQAARAAYNQQQATKNAARAATLALREAIAALAFGGSEALKKIKAKGMTDPNAFVLAEIPAPATPSPVGPPGTPSDLKVELLPNGALQLAWKCANPAGAGGTIYHVYRKIGAGGFVFLNTVGPKKFMDATVPAGTTQVIYQITAVRSTAKGVDAQFIVNFGVGGGGEMVRRVGGAGSGRGRAEARGVTPGPAVVVIKPQGRGGGARKGLPASSLSRSAA
jgi:hypothetical protein